MFAKFIGEFQTWYDLKNQETIVAFLDTIRKNKEEIHDYQNIIENNIRQLYFKIMIFILFIQFSIELLNEEGRLSYIC